MSQRRTFVLSSLCGLFLALSVSACVVYPARGPYVAGVVTVAPPVAPVEAVGVAPVPGYAWIGGYWNWVGGRHVWVNGYWAAPPHPGYFWRPNVWVRTGAGWRLRAGYWAHR